MIREYEPRDLEALKRIHSRSGLPTSCMPDLQSNLFCVKLCAEKSGQVVQAGFIRLIGEAFVLVDHTCENPGERWKTLTDLTMRALAEAHIAGLESVSAWIPPEVEKSFGPRLMDLGWIKSPWQSYTALLE
jgi:hypothetical protein